MTNASGIREMKEKDMWFNLSDNLIDVTCKKEILGIFFFSKHSFLSLLRCNTNNGSITKVHHIRTRIYMCMTIWRKSESSVIQIR